MVNRLVKLPENQSFFLFGPRGSGKTSLLKARFEGKNVLFLDLLNPRIEDQFRMNPESLIAQISAQKPDWVVIDEVQKLPRILDLVHLLIEEKKQKFALTGSSARKLKRGSANLLAGRAFMNHLFPFSALELGKQFSLEQALSFGLLPKVQYLENTQDKIDFLESYALTYLKEEIQAEQVIRRIDPFRQFLQVAAQMNGKIINYRKIARDVGVDSTTVQNYFSILEDTLIGFYLPSYSKSIRKRQREAPKFYLFDPGIVRALSKNLDVKLKPGNYAYGDAFEHFVILEIFKLISYCKKRWDISYLRTKDDAEIDLIIEVSQGKTICIEIKSSDNIRENDLAKFIEISKDVPRSKSYCFSNDLGPKNFSHVQCLHWTDGLKEIGLV